MKVTHGGNSEMRARLGIPPKLGYGPIGNGAEVPPDETLWFVVKLVKIEDTSTPTT